MARDLDRHTRHTLFLLVTALFATMATDVFTTLQSDRLHAFVARALTLEREIEGLREAVVAVETGARGYVITGQDTFLEPLRRGERELATRLSTLRQLTREEPAQQRRIERLTLLTRERLEISKRMVSARDAAGIEAARALVVTGAGRLLTDQIRATIEEMADDQRRLLVARSDAAGRMGRWAVATSALVAGLVVLAAVVLQRHGRRLRGRVIRSDRLAAVGRLAASVAHELNSPRAVVGANVRFTRELILETLPDSEHRRDMLAALDDADVATRRAARTVGDLLSASRRAPPLRLARSHDERDAEHRARAA